MVGEPSQPGQINGDVINQDQWWWDAYGKRHNIDTMPLDYVLNVYTMCCEHRVLRDGFPYSPLSDKLRRRMLDAMGYPEAT